MAKKKDLSGLKIPEHVAFILDGNGRWAKKHHVPKNVGHSRGSDAVEKMVQTAYDFGIKYVSVYAFSTENWNRSEKEVSALMKLLRDYLKQCLKKSKENNMRCLVIGDKSGLDQDIQDRIDELEEFSKDFDGITLIIALNYGSRDEIRRAVVDIAKEVKDGKIDPEDITEDTISNHLDTKGIPDPDLLIRTSGEIRLSNFLMWQSAYTEYYFPDVLWPDFKEKHLLAAVQEYNKRDRRYGGRNDDEEE
ncbi:MAG: isoprenyl transferase [Eubacterium sp.]|nr:isoprenyl transferase [Eubacterium sp.]